MNGMTIVSAMGPMRKAVTGAAAFSSSCANPKTRPWRSKAIDRWSTVCSAASMTGTSPSHTTMPMTSGTIEERRANTEQTVQFTRLPSRMTRNGREPSPNRATTRPPAMNERLIPPHRKPHVSTETRFSP